MTVSASFYYGVEEDDNFLQVVNDGDVIDSMCFMQEIYEEIDFSGLVITGCSFENCMFSKCCFADTRFVNCEFSGTSMEDCDLTSADFDGSKTEGYGVNYGLEIKDSCLEKASFQSAEIDTLKLDNCDLTEVVGLHRIQSMAPSIVNCKLHPFKDMSSALASFMVSAATMLGSALKSKSNTETTSSNSVYKAPSKKAVLFCSNGVTSFFKEENNVEEAVCSLHERDQAVSASAA